jgi:hypothetical protein
MQPQPKTLADLLALTGTGTLELRHPMAPEVKLTVLAHHHASGKAITFAAYAEVDGDAADECRVADLTGLTPDCELHTAVAMLESVRGAASTWPTLTESLA